MAALHTRGGAAALCAPTPTPCAACRPARLPAVVLLQWTKACPQAFLPLLEGLASQVRELWEAGRIRAGAPRQPGGSSTEARGGPVSRSPRPAPALRAFTWLAPARSAPAAPPPLQPLSPPPAGEKNALQEAIVGAVTAGPPELQAQASGRGCCRAPA